MKPRNALPRKDDLPAWILDHGLCPDCQGPVDIKRPEIESYPINVVWIEAQCIHCLAWYRLYLTLNSSERLTQ